MSGDFASLYASLGISPDCDIERLKLMFRKRISELHPDRGGGLSEEELLQLYFKALRFHRRHGRFPGGRSLSRMPERSRFAQQALPDAGAATATGNGSQPAAFGPASKEVERARMLRAGVVIPAVTMLALLILGYAVWNSEEAAMDEPPAEVMAPG